MKISSSTTAFAVCILALAFGAGCSNPADDKPEAVVSEAEPSPVASTDGERYVLAEGSSVGFVGSKVTGSHDGGFHVIDGQIMLVGGDPTLSSVSVEIDTTSMWADSEKLTGHLKSPDFFDVEEYPKSTFESASITREGEQFTITGNLQLHGVVRKISFPATIAVEPERVTAQAEFVIKRFDFKIEYAGRADDLIRDEVVIKFDLVAVPESAG